MASVVVVEHNLGDFHRWLDRITDNQLPFATALALTRTAQSVQDVARQRLDQVFTIRNNWVSKGIQVEAANKRDGFYRMAAKVGSVDKFMVAQELGGEKRPRSGRAVSVPLDIRRSKKDVTRPSKWPGKLLKGKGGKRKYFVRELASGEFKGRMAVLRRVGRDAYPLQVLYLFEPEVEIKPRWQLRRIGDEIAPRAAPFHFQAAMEQAMRSAR